MAEKSLVPVYTKTLIEVSKQLRSIDIQRLVFLCRDLVVHHDLDKINTGMELFQALEQEKHIQKDIDISLLLEMFYAAKRVDLSDDVAAEMNVPKFTADTKRAISRYRYLLLEIAITLSDQEIEEVTFMAAELLGCAKDNIQDMYHLLVLLEKEGYISAGNVLCLHQDLITHQRLNKKIKDYEEAMTKVSKEEEKGKGRKSYVEGCMQGASHTLHPAGDNMAEGSGTTNDNGIITTENRDQELQPCSDQAGISSSIEQQHQALLPAEAALPASIITAENLNMGETQNVVSGDQTYIQHVDRHIERNIETNIETQVVYNIGEEKKDNSSFNLEAVRRQLKDEYLETRGKLPLLPGMPEEFATMEDLFVDLHIVEEEKKPFGVISRQLKTYGDIACITQEVEKGGRKEIREVKRILVRGKPGIGKSSTASKLAYDWACSNQDSPISKFQLLFAITIHEINANTDLIGVIQDQLLPEVSRQSLKDYLQSNASSVVILLDGYDEASKYFHQSRDIKNVLRSKWLSEACVIVTTRPNQVGKFTQNHGPYLQVEILGFSDDERKKLYVEKFMKSDKSQEFLDYLDKSSLKELASIPIILSMLCLLWAENQKLPSTITALYKTVITHLAKHSYSKTATDDLNMACVQNWIDSVFNQMGEVALEGLFEDRLVFSSHKFKPKSLEQGCSLGIVTKEKKRSGLTVTYNVTFLHKTFQEFCAAHFWVGLIEKDEEKFKNYLKKVNDDKNIGEMWVLLRFVCGLNLKAAEIILPYLVPILCQPEGLLDDKGDVENIFDLNCQYAGIVLLHEAESNNAEVGQCIELHKHLKPLIKTVTIDSSSWEADEFHEILTAYISSAQSPVNDSTSDGHLWLDDVEEVYVKWNHFDNDDDVKCVSELVCAMSRISIFRIVQESRYGMIGHLVSNHFSTTFLSELHLEDVECEVNQFAQFLSTIKSLNKCVLKRVSLKGDLSFIPTPPKVQELHIEYKYKCGMKSLPDCFIACSSCVYSELHVIDVECDVNQFAQFLSTIKSLNKFVLKRVSLKGDLSFTPTPPTVQELRIEYKYKCALKSLPDCFIACSSCVYSELHVIDVECDVNQFAQFLSTIKSLNKFVLKRVSLKGDLSFTPTPPTVQELRIEYKYKCGMKSLPDCFIACSSCVYSELHVIDVECDVNQFAQFLSTIKSLNKFVLERVSLKGDLSVTPTLPTVQELHIEQCDMKPLLDFFITCTSCVYSELHVRYAECDINQFAQFLSTIKCLNKFILKGVSLKGNLSFTPTLPTVQELHIENKYEYDMNPLLDCFIACTSCVHSELHVIDFKCDVNQFAQFLSTIKSLNKFVLKRVSLNGDLSITPTLPTVQELHIEKCDMKPLLDCFIACCPCIFSQLCLIHVECDVNQFAQFLSTITSLHKFVLKRMSLNGDLTVMPTLSTVQELHIEKCDMKQFIGCFIACSSCKLSELRLIHIECDVNQFAQFLSTVTSLNKVVLDQVALKGDLSFTPTLPRVQELHIKYIYKSDMKSLLHYFIACSSCKLSQLHLIHIECDVNQFAPFLSTIRPLNKFVLKAVSLVGDLSVTPTLPTVQELHIEDCDMTPLPDCFIACSSCIFSELHVIDIECDVNQFAQFLSTITSLNTCVLKRVTLEGDLSVTPTLPTVQELQIENCDKNSLFDIFQK